jgi:hypothetical protein
MQHASKGGNYVFMHTYIYIDREREREMISYPTPIEEYITKIVKHNKVINTYVSSTELSLALAGSAEPGPPCLASLYPLAWIAKAPSPLPVPVNLRK